MARSIAILLLAAGLAAGCTGEPEEDVRTETAATSTDGTADGYLDKVSRARQKAREMADDENKRVEEVDAVIEDP